MTGTTLRHPGDPFPASGVNLPGGRTLHLPEDLAGRFGVVLFYRGARWFYRGARCPCRNAQLSAFQLVLDGLAAVDASILALLVNDEATTRDLIARRGLRFSVGHSAGATAVADATGASADPDPPFPQSAGFALDPGGRAIVSVYSSAALGRLVPQDVTGLVRYLRGHAPPARLMSGSEPSAPADGAAVCAPVRDLR
jgi:peroxiredoxin